MSREMKRHDTADPITGTAYQEDPVTGALTRADLTVFQTIRYQMKVPGANTFVGGTAVDIEKTEGAGQTAADGLPLNRGRWRYQQTDDDVDTSGGYAAELECVLANGKKVHFPSREQDNPTVTISNDIDNA
jgi:hypothetical protein